jgi:hypothetical protein
MKPSSLLPLLLLTTGACNEPEPSRVEPTELLESLVVEEKQPRDIALGPVNLQLDEAWTEDEVRQFRVLAEKVFARLTTELGSEIMNQLEPLFVPVLKGDIKEIRGRVGLQTLTFVYDENIEPQVDLNVEPTGGLNLTLSELSEGNIAHEFMHLFAQGSYFGSDGFSEGMIYGYIHMLYPDYYPNAAGMYFNEVKSPCIAALMDKGVDTHFFDVQRGGGVQDPTLDKIRDSHWGIVWSEYLKAHPRFIKAFFEKIKTEREKGTLYFSKEELIKIAISADPEFMLWMESEGSSNNDISKEERNIFFTRTAPDEYYVVNAHFFPGSKGDGEIIPSVISHGFTSTKPVNIKIDQGGKTVDAGSFPLESTTRLAVSGYEASGDTMWLQVGNTKIDLCVTP